MDLNFLKKIPLFTELNNEEIVLVSKCLHHTKIKEGEFLFHENERGNELFILYKGKVEISKKMTLIEEQNKVDKTLIILDADMHAFFGEIGLLGYKRRTASPCGKTDCELYKMNQPDFTKICEEHPQVGVKILLQICLKLSNLLEKTDSDILKLTTALIYALRH